MRLTSPLKPHDFPGHIKYQVEGTRIERCKSGWPAITVAMLLTSVFPATQPTLPAPVQAARDWLALEHRLHHGNVVLTARSEAGTPLGCVELHTRRYLRHAAPELSPAQAALLQPYLASLAVRPEARRRGIGSLLVQAAIDEACLGIAEGNSRLLLQVEADNHGALRLYEEAGFQPVFINSASRSVLMELRLTPHTLAARAKHLHLSC
mmetsp:Transcript_5613/g.12221  ORF Transcript_5613/g.12221 Transcript_5613/m.12221 type:complete len:208 (+) Transcript_5613:287-910(+)|eukprot:4584823-Pleurochrysis_carterae.AAC.5